MKKSTDEIDVMPTKRFFVDMLTRDIPLEQAILDLVDNCIDGAERIKAAKADLSAYWIEINFDNKHFSIVDNCGGFSTKTAREYAFKFGRPDKIKPSTHSIGQFGVGMKRALFKFGSEFIVRSATNSEQWAIDIDVNEWIKTETWSFPWATFKSKKISSKNPGTEIIVNNLRPEICEKFGTDRLTTTIVQLIKSKHRQFISEGLSISVNGNHADATSLYLLEKESKLKPGVYNKVFKDQGQKDVKVRIVVAVSNSAPREAGWYVIGNGRVILEADRQPKTGWGALEDGTGKLLMPHFHNQFARFRGIVSFDSDDSARIPWNTTKDDIDSDNPIWLSTQQKMIDMMRPVITFLNELDKDIDEHGQEHSPMLDVVIKAKSLKLETYFKNSDFKAPTKLQTAKAPKLVKIQYSRPTKDVEFLRNEFGVGSASAVGEKTFDLTLARQKR